MPVTRPHTSFRLRDDVPDAAVHGVLATLLRAGAVRATKYVNPTLVIRATRRRFDGKVLERGNVEVTLTIGHPNSRERQRIKTLQRAKEAFPVKKIALQYLQGPPPPRA